MERILEWTETVRDQFQTKLSPFLDPREQFIVQSIVGRETDVAVSFSGGFEQAERKRAYIYPDYLEVSPEEFRVELLSIHIKQKHIPFEHRDVLGSLLGLGVKREKFGDILLADEKAQIIVASEIAEFVEISLQQINRYQARCEKVDWEEICLPKDKWIYRDTTISSLRLDVILSELLNISRAKIVPFIKAGKVKVNWKVTERSSITLHEGDQLSVKGHGRFLFALVEGLTKKQKYRVTLGRKD